MINHARTLLMNVNGASQFHSELGEEIIPATYRAKTLPQSLINVRAVLFGREPDRAMLNYRCRQLLALIHRSELEEHITALDTRITYDFQDVPYFDDAVFRPTIRQFGGSATEAFVVGTDTAPDTAGQMRKEWDLEVTGSGQAAVSRLRPYIPTTAEFTVTEGLSSPIPLPGSGLSLMVRNIAGLKYRVTSYSRPTYALGDIAEALSMVGASTLADLFLVSTPTGNTEPFLTFRRLWEQDQRLPYRLGGLLLGLIYHTDTL